MAEELVKGTKESDLKVQKTHHFFLQFEND